MNKRTILCTIICNEKYLTTIVWNMLYKFILTLNGYYSIKSLIIPVLTKSASLDILFILLNFKAKKGYETCHMENIRVFRLRV